MKRVKKQTGRGNRENCGNLLDVDNPEINQQPLQPTNLQWRVSQHSIP